MFIDFHSDNFINKKGFNATYTEMDGNYFKIIVTFFTYGRHLQTLVTENAVFTVTVTYKYIQSIGMCRINITDFLPSFRLIEVVFVHAQAHSVTCIISSPR